MEEPLPTFAENHGSDTPDLTKYFNALGKTIAVDFDGTIHPYSKGWIGSIPDDEPPIPGAGDFLKWCVEHGFKVVIFSTRADHIQGLQGIKSWLNKWRLNIYVSEVTHRKPPAVAYVDDRAIPYSGNWDSVLSGVMSLSMGKSDGAAGKLIEGE